MIHLKKSNVLHNKGHNSLAVIIMLLMLAEATIQNHRVHKENLYACIEGRVSRGTKGEHYSNCPTYINNTEHWPGQPPTAPHHLLSL